MVETKIIATAEAENRGEVYKTDMKVHGHSAIADELPLYGGKDSGPAPGDYLCMALASCKVITLRMYVQRKKWAVEVIRVKVELVKGGDLASEKPTFHSEVFVTGDLNEEQKSRLLHIAKVCPIDKLLTKGSHMVTKLL